MQLAHRFAIERAQLRLVDDVKTDQRMHRSVVERDLEAERFEQIIGEQRIVKGAALAISFV